MNNFEIFLAIHTGLKVEITKDLLYCELICLLVTFNEDLKHRLLKFEQRQLTDMDKRREFVISTLPKTFYLPTLKCN